MVSSGNPAALYFFEISFDRIVPAVRSVFLMSNDAVYFLPVIPMQVLLLPVISSPVHLQVHDPVLPVYTSLCIVKPVLYIKSVKDQVCYISNG